MRNKNRLIYSSIILIVAGLLSLTGKMFVQAQEEGLSREEALRRSAEYFQQGEEFYSRGDFARADEEFKRAQELLNNLQQEQAGVKQEIEEVNYAGYLKKALESSKSGDSEKAVSGYLKVIEHYPNNPGLHYNLGIEYLKTRRFDKAIEEFNKVIHLDPEDKDAYYNLGVLHENYLKNLKLASFYYSRYVKLARRGADVKEVKSWIRQIDKKLKQEEKGL